MLNVSGIAPIVRKNHVNLHDKNLWAYNSFRLGSNRMFF